MGTIQRASRHPLTEQYIALVGGGMTPFEAGMKLVPLLPLMQVQTQVDDWETDLEVCKRIDALIAERAKLAQRVRESVLERLLGVVHQDVRLYFRSADLETPDCVKPIPITQWTRSMSSAVKKVKFTQKTDPFGTTTETVNLEFHDPMAAIKELRAIAPEVFDTVELSKTDGAVDVVAIEKLSPQELDDLHSRLIKAL